MILNIPLIQFLNDYHNLRSHHKFTISNLIDQLNILLSKIINREMLRNIILLEISSR